MISVIVFGEDYAHEVVLRTLLKRLAEANDVEIKLRVRSATGGVPRMLAELEEYLGELRQGWVAHPDFFVVARDANCDGYAKRKKEISRVMADFQGRIVLAVPDPHIERWLLLDSQAFKQVLGQSCQAPDQKCNRDRYKQLLDSAVRKAGVEPLLGGIEFAEEIMNAIHLDRACSADSSFHRLIQDIRAAFESRKSR